MIHKLIKFTCTALALFLVLENVNKNSAQAIRAYVTPTKVGAYVSDIVGYSPDLEDYSEAKVNQYSADGYIKVDDDLNGISGGDKAVYLMYKTTTDASKALRKISTMEMNGGYYDWNYSEFIEGHVDNINMSVNDFIGAVDQYKKNLSAGYESAKVAEELLNFYYVPNSTEDTTGPLLSSWFNESHSFDQYKKVLLYSNSTISTNIMTALLLGSIDNSSTTWLDRFVENLSDPICDVSDAENEGEYDVLRNEYGASLDVIQGNIAHFYESFESADRKVTNGLMDFNDAPDSIDDATKEMLKAVEEQDGSDTGDVLYLECNNLLSNYPVFNVGGKEANITLADVVREIGLGDVDSSLGYLYALLNALNPGQYYGLKNGGLGNLLLYTSFDIEPDKKDLTGDAKTLYEEKGNLDAIRKNISETKRKLISMVNTDCLSVYIATNTDLLEKRCAMTNQAARSNAALGSFDELVADDELQDNLIAALVIIGYCAGIAASVALASFSLGMLLFWGASFMQVVAVGITATFGWLSVTVTTFLGGVVGTTGLIGVAICIVAAIIVGIIMLVKKIKETVAELNEEYPPAPEVIIDNDTIDGQECYFRYNAIMNICNDKPLDINFQKTVKTLGIKGIYATKWQSLYFTRDSRIGAPIVVKDGKFMTVTYGDDSIDTTGMYPVCKFGNYLKTDLKSYLKADVEEMYIHYYIEGTPLDPTFKNGKFLESVTIKTGKDKQATKTALTNEGFTLIDYNLSPSNDYSCYIGFKTTDDREQALTDIRVAWNNTSDAIYWGDTSNSYGFAGSAQQDVANKGDNKCHISLYYTKKSSLGSPILSHVNKSENETPDGLAIYNNAADAPEGLEGINYFSGGRAADFNFFNKIGTKKWNDTKSFIFFKPEKQYTSENSEIYISGISAFTGVEEVSKFHMEDLHKQSGFLPNVIGNVTYPSINKGYDLAGTTGSLTLEAAYTYNPYRAIYDLGIFTGQENCPTMPYNLTAHNQGYIASNVYVQGNKEFFGGNTFSKGNWRVIRDTHTIINNHNKDLDEGVTGFNKWVMLPRAFYLAGPTSGRKPLKYEDIKVYNNAKDIPNNRVGLNSVHELKSTYFDDTNESGQSVANTCDIGLYREGLDTEHFYMFYNAPARVKPKYVSNVTAYESKEEKQAYNLTIMNLMSQGCDEIIEDYTISKQNKDKESFFKQKFFHIEGTKNIFRNIDKGDEWAQTYGSHQEGVGFVGITYTNKKSEALGSIRTYYMSALDFVYTNKLQSPASSMDFVIDNSGATAKFNRTSDKITAEVGQYMWIYTSTVGQKITSVCIDREFSVNITDEQIANHNVRLGRYVVTDQNMCKYGTFHLDMYYETEEPTYIKEICYDVVHKNTISERVSDMLAKGCSDFRIYYITKLYALVIGLVRTNSKAEAIKDIRITSNQEFDPTIGKNTYLSATRVKGAYNSYPSDLFNIYYTRGTSRENKYALTDFYFGLTSETNSGEMVYDLGISSDVADATLDKNFKSSFLSNEYAAFMVRKTDTEWGFNGPSSSTASIFSDNPSLSVLLPFVGISVLTAVSVALFKYCDKRKKVSA